jgi:hypothetical protein
MIISPVGSIAVTQAQINAGAVVLRVGPGMLCNILVTTVTAVQALNLFDNATTATGVQIGLVITGTAAGQLLTFNMPFVNGLVIQQAAAFTGAITVSIG